MAQDPPVGTDKMVPTTPIVQFQAVQQSGLLFTLLSDGTLWYTHFPDGVANPPPVWNKFWPQP